MIEPWRRGRTRLGLSWGWPASRGEQAIGWAILQIGPANSSIRHEAVYLGDPYEQGLARARTAIADGATGVDLHCYVDDEAFALSRAAAEGMTREDHLLMVAKLRSALRGEGIDVITNWLDRDGYILGQRSDDDFTIPDFLRSK